MKEDNKTILEIIISVIVVAILILALIKVIRYSNKTSEEYRQSQIQEIDECIEKANDFDWCMDKFLK